MPATDREEPGRGRARQRIRALLVLAEEDRGGTPAERQVARAKAEMLAERHGVDLDELISLAQEGLDREPGELLVELGERHTVWSGMLLDQIAYRLELSARHATHRTRILHGPAGLIAHAARAHAEAFTAIEDAHDHLTAHADLTGRRAHRYLHARYPDTGLHPEILAQLRYQPASRLATNVAAVLALRPAAAVQVAEALARGHVATVDADPRGLQAAYFAAAIDEVSQRLAALQHHRNPPPPPAEPDPPPGQEAWEEADLSDLLADLPPLPRRARRRVRAERAWPTWDPAVHQAGREAGARVPIGLTNL